MDMEDVIKILLEDIKLLSTQLAKVKGDYSVDMAWMRSEIISKAREESFNQGYQKGYDEGYKKKMLNLEQELKRVERKREQVERLLSEALQKLCATPNESKNAARCEEEL